MKKFLSILAAVFCVATSQAQVSVEQADKYYEEGRSFFFQLPPDRVNAFKSFSSAASIYEQLGAETRMAGETFFWIGTILHGDGDDARAIEYYNKALPIYEQVEDLSSNYICLLVSLETAYRAQGEFDKVLYFHEKVKSLYEQGVSVWCYDYVVTSYNNAGIACQVKASYDLAITYLHKALEIQENFFGTEHIDTAYICGDIVSVLLSQQDYVGAEKFLKNKLADFEEVLDLEHVNTAILYNSLGKVYNSQGDYTEAAECWKRALPVYEKVFGKKNDDTKALRKSLADIK